MLCNAALDTDQDASIKSLNCSEQKLCEQDARKRVEACAIRSVDGAKGMLRSDEHMIAPQGVASAVSEQDDDESDADSCSSDLDWDRDARTRQVKPRQDGRQGADGSRSHVLKNHDSQNSKPLSRTNDLMRGMAAHHHDNLALRRENSRFGGYQKGGLNRKRDAKTLLKSSAGERVVSDSPADEGEQGTGHVGSWSYDGGSAHGVGETLVDIYMGAEGHDSCEAPSDCELCL